MKYILLLAMFLSLAVGADSTKEKFDSQNLWMCMNMASTGWQMGTKGYSEQDATNVAARIYNHDTNGLMKILRREAR